ncbi:MAG: hypothetical protein K2P58_02595 [Hyphomonadaceae bacterium]|nr:hypothetical protein [Hyphomonadaceae bacterium]
MPKLCDDTRLQGLIDAHTKGDSERVAKTQALAAEFPDDARLQFMLGSALIGEGRLIEGHVNLSRAVELAPDFAIARFQLGLFQLTSGEADNALETWARLDRLPDGHYLRHFVDGLRSLIRDEFRACTTHLEAGIRANTENAPLNSDMQLVIARCREAEAQSAQSSEEPTTETSMLLQRFRPDERPN